MSDYVILHPHVCFARVKPPSESDVLAMHHAAHEECYIANSVKTVVETESTWEIAAR